MPATKATVLSSLADMSRAARLDRWPVMGPFLRGSGRFLNEWAHRENGVQATVDGDIDIRLSPRAFSGGRYAFDPGLTAELRGVARPGRTFVDVGAHLGIAALIYSELAGPETRVCAFEPNPNVFPTLVDNTRVNGSAVECFRLALGADVGPCGFFATGSDANASLSHDAPGKYWYWADRPKPVMQEFRVTMSTLDQICSALGLAPGVIKLDVEGAELRVLQGGADILRRWRPLILLETHVFAWDSFGYSRQDLEEEIARLEYVVTDRSATPFVGPLGSGPEPDNNHYLLTPR